MARILIAGCGLTGSAAGMALAEDGHEVYGLRRRPPQDSRHIRYINADLSVGEDLTKIDTKFDLVIYILTPDSRDEKSYRKVFIDGLNNLLEVFSQKSPAARFIFVSSTSVYGQSHGEWVDENSVTEPKSATGRTILQAEDAVLSSSADNCIIRFSGIYGRGKSHLLDAVVSAQETQYEPPYYMNRIHWQDCVGVICFISSRMTAGLDIESVYLASDDDPAPKWEVFNYLADKLGIAPPGKAVVPPCTSQNKRCSNKRLKQLGYRFRYPGYRQGFSDVSSSDIDT